MIHRFSMLTAVAAATLALGACGSSSKSSDSGSTPAPATQATSTAQKSKVKFLTPRDGATVGSDFTAKVRLANFKIAPKAVGQAPKPGEGHLHFQLDGGKFDYPRYSGPNGKIAKKLGVTGTYSPALAPAISYKGIPAGRHKLEVYLANNNHTDTGVEAETEFTVR